MIKGARVRLRPFRSDDLSVLRRWFDDPAIMSGWAKPEPLVLERQFEEDLSGRFARFDDAIYLAIEDETGRLIGRIDAESIDHHNASAEIMLLIGKSDAHGRGYGRDAVAAFCRYLFLHVGLHRVELTALASNKAAIRAYRAVGFREEGRLRDHLYFDGRYHTQVVMALLRQDFVTSVESAQPVAPEE